MNDNIKTSVGMLVPLSSLGIFIYFSLLGNFYVAILAAIGGVLLWYLYSLVVKTKMPDITGNVVILFGSLLAVAFFLNYGVSKNMFGGFNISLEGTAVSAVVLFFSVLLGISLRSGSLASIQTKTPEDPTPLPDSLSVKAPALETEALETNDPSEVSGDNYSYYNTSEFEYPDYYDYEYGEDFYDGGE